MMWLNVASDDEVKLGERRGILGAKGTAEEGAKAARTIYLKIRCGAIARAEP